MAGEQNVWNGVNGAIAAAGSLEGAIGSKSASVPQTRESQTSLSGSITPQGGFNPLFNAGFQLSSIPKIITEKNMNYKFDI